MLGANLLSGRGGSFERSFRSQQEELEFEFTFFLDHLERGFDVERCCWNWQKKFREPTSQRPITSTVRADRGWQPSGTKVIAGGTYQFECTGDWSISADAEEHGAEGNEQESGKLAGCLFDGESLSELFQIDPSMPFVAPAAGQLFLRCEDDWTSLSDNTGQLSVGISLM